MKKQASAGQQCRRLNFCCTEAEFQKIQDQFRNTTDRSYSAYARKMLLASPVKMISRNRSLDELIDTLGGLRNTLETITEKPGWNVVGHTELTNILLEIRTVTYKIADLCMPNQS